MKANTVEYFGDGVFLEPPNFEVAEQRRANRAQRRNPHRGWTVRRAIHTLGSRLASGLDRVFLPLNSGSTVFDWTCNGTRRQASARIAGLERYFY